MGDYIGRFHPVVVHLPIGILLAAIFIQFLSLVKGFKKIRRAVKVLLLIGIASALTALLTGLLHAQSGEFNAELVQRHSALAILVTILAIVATLLHGQKMKEMKAGYFVVLIALGFLILFTGHTGGSITHGSDFLSFPRESKRPSNEASSILPITSTSLVYADLVAPILKKNCTSCHGPAKQKGKLRLDQPEYISKGGEDGSILKGGSQGEMFKRINLPLEDEDHMPPKEKLQLTGAEVSLISSWLENGASFEATVSELPGSDSLLNLVKVRKESGVNDLDKTELPVDPPDAAILKELRDAGVAVSFISQGDGRISLQFINVDSTKARALLGRLPQINRQTVELKFPSIKLAPDQWAFLRSMTTLKRLSLEHSNFSDREVQFLAFCNNLQYLSLVGTQISADGLQKLELKNLKNLYLFNTNVKKEELTRLQEHFPNAVIELGNYKVTTLPSDTTIKK